MVKAVTALKMIALGLLLCVISACSPAQATKPFYTQVSEPKLKAGETIPAPTGTVILTVTGKIGTTNQDNSIVMDRDMIESVGQIEYKVTDPFENKPYVYRGPLMSDLLNLWKVPEDAQTLKVAALDDYTVEVPIGEVRKYPVIFALQQEGQYMPTSTRGPAMLVFPYDNFKFDVTVYNNYWAWQIKSIEVK